MSSGQPTTNLGQQASANTLVAYSNVVSPSFSQPDYTFGSPSSPISVTSLNFPFVIPSSVNINNINKFIIYWSLPVGATQLSIGLQGLDANWVNFYTLNTSLVFTSYGSGNLGGVECNGFGINPSGTNGVNANVGFYLSATTTQVLTGKLVITLNLD